MESKFQLTYNGQQIITDDINLMADVGALADDRVLAELFHLPPYDGTTVSRGIVPAALYGKGLTWAAQVGPNGATGSVLVQPFRAVIGSRTLASAGGKANWRDIRSAIAVGSAALGSSVSFGANASGNPRWDLVYAAVSVDANGASVSRKVKSPTTKVITGQSVVTTLATTVSLAVVAGTTAASPVWPSAPTDTGSTYYIPLAYVRIPNGFTASSTVAANNIALVANMLGLASAVGNSVSLATVNNQKNISTAQQGAWGSSGSPTMQFAPPLAGGMESLFLYLNVDAAGTNTNVPNDGSVVILDSSRNWSKRYFRVTAGFGAVFNAVAQNGPGYRYTGRTADFTGQLTSPGNTVGGVITTYPEGASGLLFYVSGSSQPAVGFFYSPIGAGKSITFFVDSSGRLCAQTSGAVQCQGYLWLEATPRFE